MKLYLDTIGNLSVAQSANTQQVVGVYSTDLYGTSPSPSGSTNNYQQGGYSDYRYDPNSGVIQAGARIYDPNIGRFMQQDPMTFGSGDSTYFYNNPANYHDPTGLAPTCQQIFKVGVVSALIGATMLV